MRTCPEPCGKRVDDGYLCHACTATLAATICSAPMWADQLGLVLVRLTRYTDPSGRRNAAAPLPYNPAASGPAQWLDASLRAAADAYGCPKDVRHGRLGLVAAWLRANVDLIRVSEDAGYWTGRITAAVVRASEVCDRPPDQWYAGTCPDCARDLYPSTDDEYVKCPCGKTWRVDERRTELLKAARNVEAPGPVIARALTSLDAPVTQELLRKWRHKGKLKARGMTEGPHPANKYRVGDVLDLITKEERRRRR